MYSGMSDEITKADDEEATKTETTKPDETIKTERSTLIDPPPKEFKANRYAANKTAGQAATNLALVTSNAAQLKVTLDEGAKHPYYIFFIISLTTSIALQVLLGFLLLWVSSREGKLKAAKSRHTKKTDKLNSVTIFIVFGISILNVILNGFTASRSVPDSGGGNKTT